MRSAFTVIGWATCIVLAACTLSRWLRVDVHSTLLIAASGLAPLILIPAWIITPPALLMNARWLAGLSAVLVAVHLTVLAPLVIGGRGLTQAQRSTSATHLRVLALNVKYDQSDGAAISRQIRQANPDLIVLSELSPRVLDGLDLRAYPYSVSRPQDNASGNGIYSRFPLDQAEIRDVSFTPMAEAVVVLPTGQRVQLFQVHPVSPTSAERRLIWRAQLDHLRDDLRNSTGPTIMAGDFNSAHGHADFARLLGGPTGIADTADGRGLHATWPSDAPVLRLDHVLVSREIGVKSSRVLGRTGSDHRAVLTDLRIATENG